MGVVMLILGIALAVGIMLFVNKTEKISKDVATLFIASFLVGLVLEIFTFNYTTYENIGQSLNKSESIITFNGTEADSSNSNYRAQKETGNEKTAFLVGIHNINSKVNDIYIEPDKMMGKVKVDIAYQDEVFTKNTPLADSDLYVVSGVESTEHIRVHLAGKVSAIKLRLEPSSEGVQNANV